MDWLDRDTWFPTYLRIIIIVCLFVLENTLKSDRNKNSSTRSRPCIKQVKACCVWLQPRCLEFLHPKGRAIIRSVRVGQELKPLWGMAKKGFYSAPICHSGIIEVGGCVVGLMWKRVFLRRCIVFHYRLHLVKKHVLLIGDDKEWIRLTHVLGRCG